MNHLNAANAMEREPDRAKWDQFGKAAIKQAFDGRRGRYGARKGWHRSGHALEPMAGRRDLRNNAVEQTS